MELLDTLLTEVSSPTAQRLPTVVLESLVVQRERVLAGYLLRNWFDQVLAIAERSLALAILGFFGWWMATGYGYDLWHSWSTPASATAAHSYPAITTQPSGGRPAPGRPGLAVRSASFLLNKVPHAPHRTAGTHPELGFVLPVAPEQPQAVADEDRRLTKDREPRFNAVMRATPTPPITPAVSSEQLPEATPVPAPSIVDRLPVHISAPAIALDAPVTEVFLQNGVWQVAEYAAGYLHDTGGAGDGNLVMAGHKGIRGAVFSRLEQLQPGQDIWIDTAHDRFHYLVQSTYRVWPNQVEVLYPTDEPMLTLLTCTNWDTQRFVVRASLVDSAPLPPSN